MEQVSKGEAMGKCQDILSAASERNPLQVIVCSINDRGEIQVSRCGDAAGMSAMLMNIQVLVQDEFRKQLRL